MNVCAMRGMPCMCVLLVRVQCHYVRAISACAMSLRACYKGVCNVIACVLLVRVQCHCVRAISASAVSLRACY